MKKRGGITVALLLLLCICTNVARTQPMSMEQAFGVFTQLKVDIDEVKDDDDIFNMHTDSQLKIFLESMKSRVDSIYKVPMMKTYKRTFNTIKIDINIIIGKIQANEDLFESFKKQFQKCKTSLQRFIASDSSDSDMESDAYNLLNPLESIVQNHNFYKQNKNLENTESILSKSDIFNGVLKKWKKKIPRKEKRNLKSWTKCVKNLKSIAKEWKSNIILIKNTVQGIPGLPGIRSCVEDATSPAEKPKAPENGFVGEGDTPCTFVVWCKPGFKLVGRSRFDITAPADIGDEAETKCLPSHVGYWPLNRQDQGKNFAEHFHNPSTGSTVKVEDAVLNSIKYGDGVQGGMQDAIQVSTASDSSIAIQNQNRLLSFDGSFTWLLYVSPRRKQLNGYILDASTTNKEMVSIKMISAKLITTITTSTGDTYELRSKDSIFVHKQWLYISFSFDAKTKSMKQFINGELLQEKVIQLKGNVLTDSKQILLGKAVTGGDVTRMLFACVSAYTVALNETGILTAMGRCIQANLIASWLFDKQNGQMDMSGNGNHATSYFAKFADGITNEKKGSMKTGKIRFPSGKEITTYIMIPSLRIDQRLTFAGCIYIEALVDDSPVVDFSTVDTVGFHIWILKGGVIFVRFGEFDQTRKMDSIKIEKFQGKSVFKEHIWYHIAFTYNGHTGEASLYVDGEQVTMQSLLTVKGLISGTGFLGKTLQNNAFFDGRFTCIQFFEESLNQAEINEVMKKCQKVRATAENANCGLQINKPAFGRIVGGQPAFPHSWPWMARITYRELHICGGSIFKKRIIISAAHCFWPRKDISELKVYIGSHSRSDPAPSEQVFKVARIIQHPKYNPATYDNDIALVYLVDDMTYGDEVQPCCLTDQNVRDNYVCVATGWGFTQNVNESADILRQAKIPVLNRGVCNNKMETPISKNMLCGGYWEGDIDTCSGDSGGPLMCQFGRDPAYKLVGIVSWGEGSVCGVPNKAGVYTHVFIYIKWIKATIATTVSYTTTTESTSTTTTTTTRRITTVSTTPTTTSTTTTTPTTTSTTTPPTTTPTTTKATLPGTVRPNTLRGIHWTTFDECLDCICQASVNGCQISSLSKCFKDSNGFERCGPFDISMADWIACKRHGESIGFNWKTCATHASCSRHCIRDYLNAQKGNCPLNEVCEDLARMWFFKSPGSCGFHAPGVDSYWRKIESGSCFGGTPCLDCLCEAHGCEANLGKCVDDEGTERCGPMNIGYVAWSECGRPGGSWKACARDSMACSRHCVVKYLNRYRGACTRKGNPAAITCEEDARLWFAGPAWGCHDTNFWTTDYWNSVDQCLKTRHDK
ncbi:unnamed protein product [Owenia fusiformis]|uniref:Acrosin n=1 Tax=Owenia fusiformis TaxID=6347 RepID=A0A8S4NAQ5_OWEFU|nr:unnamed protein product [Owenia fusiformis]